MQTYLELVKIVTPSIFAIFLIFINEHINKRAKSNEYANNSLKQRISELYFPFFKTIYVASGINGISVIEFDPISLSAMNEILINNIYLSHTTTQYKILSYYLLSCQLISLRLKGDFDTSEICRKLQEHFDSMYKDLLREYTDICYKLELPKPVDIFSYY